MTLALGTLVAAVVAVLAAIVAGLRRKVQAIRESEAMWKRIAEDNQKALHEMTDRLVAACTRYPKRESGT